MAAFHQQQDKQTNAHVLVTRKPRFLHLSLSNAVIVKSVGSCSKHQRVFEFIFLLQTSSLFLYPLFDSDFRPFGNFFSRPPSCSSTLFIIAGPHSSKKEHKTKRKNCKLHDHHNRKSNISYHMQGTLLLFLCLDRGFPAMILAGE